MSEETTSTSSNTIAIISHITLIGWIIALVMHQNDRTSLGVFYIRQVLGLFLLMFVSSFIPFLNLILVPVVLVLWLLSLIGAVQSKEQLTPVLGPMFQDWFKGIS